MEIILIRHGQSRHNARLTMELDSDLTELGQEQARVTAEYLVELNIASNVSELHIYSSPFRRTLQTSRALAVKLNQYVHAYPELCEFFADSNEAYHDFCGMSSQQIANEYPFVKTDEAFLVNLEWWPKRLESTQSIYQRAEVVRDELLRRYAGSDAKIVLYSHAEPIGRLIEAFLRVPPVEGWPQWTENCGVNRLTLINDYSPAIPIIYNDVSHLKALGIESPQHVA